MLLTQILQKIASGFAKKSDAIKSIAYNSFSRNLILTKCDNTSSELRVKYSDQAEYAQKDWNGNVITDTYATKAETDNLLSGKSNTNHNHNSTYLGIKAKAESAKSADSVAWTNVSGRPTKVSQFTNDSGYITTDGAAYPRRVGGVTMNFNWSGQGGQPSWLWGGEDGTNMYVYNPSNFSVNYANSSNYTNWLRTSSHSDHLFHTEWDGSSSFWTYVTAGDGSYRAVRVERANSAAYAERSMNNGAFYISGYQIYVG